MQHSTYQRHTLHHTELIPGQNHEGQTSAARAEVEKKLLVSSFKKDIIRLGYIPEFSIVEPAGWTTALTATQQCTNDKDKGWRDPQEKVMDQICALVKVETEQLYSVKSTAYS